MKKSKKHCTGASSESELNDPFIKNAGFGTIIRNPPDPPDLPETVSATAARTLPTTRTGGQDDGSYTNTLKQKQMTIQSPMTIQLQMTIQKPMINRPRFRPNRPKQRGPKEMIEQERFPAYISAWV